LEIYYIINRSTLESFGFMPRSFKEIAHVLGLKENPYIISINNTGWNPWDAFASIKDRYERLKPVGTPKLAFNLLPYEHHLPTIEKHSKQVSKMSEGKYLGFFSNWVALPRRHSYTLHAVREGSQTHFIYVNRGMRHTEHYEPTVTVFSIDNKDAQAFTREMLTSVRAPGDERENLSLFLQKHKEKINPILSPLLGKTNQKTGNCTLANSNIAWHFQLASNYMRTHKTSFEVAYKETKEHYKKMRIKDRVEAFNQLLNHRDHYPSDKAYFYNYILALDKLTLKDARDKTNHIELLANRVNPKTFIKLISPLLDEHYGKNLQDFINQRTKEEGERPPNIRNLIEIKDRVMDKTFQKLSERKQKELINKDVSLIKHAFPNLQEALLNKDFVKYYRHLSPDLKKLYAHTPITALEQEFKKITTEILLQKKTGRDFLWMQGASDKERRINDKIRLLYTHLKNNDKENTIKVFEQLCLVCCEQRSPSLRTKYSTNTHSAKWLINNLTTLNYLKETLGINIVEETKEKIKLIVSKKNAEQPIQSQEFKDRYSKIQQSDNKAEPEPKNTLKT
jgi:hypothetical protein